MEEQAAGAPPAVIPLAEWAERRRRHQTHVRDSGKSGVTQELQDCSGDVPGDRRGGCDPNDFVRYDLRRQPRHSDHPLDAAHSRLAGPSWVFVSTAITSVIYNLVASRVGGIKVELKAKQETGYLAL